MCSHHLAGGSVRIASVFLALIFSANTALADSKAPEYSEDPFGDFALSDESLILNIDFHPAGHGEVGVLLASSMIDKYSTHIGGLIDFTYNFSDGEVGVSLLDTIAVNVSAGYAAGSLTSIVTSPQGIIGNKVLKCAEDPSTCPNGDVTPYVPDYKQVTWMASVSAIWAPLYGKINVVSEYDVNLQFYGLLGAGVNGTKEVTATANAADPRGYTLGSGDPGVMPHLTFGGGLKVFIMDWIALRAEVRGLLNFDKFDFKYRPNANATSVAPMGTYDELYAPGYVFANVGLNFLVF
jgi:outer membrane beta-barrel protein